MRYAFQFPTREGGNVLDDMNNEDNLASYFNAGIALPCLELRDERNCNVDDRRTKRRVEISIKSAHDTRT